MSKNLDVLKGFCIINAWPLLDKKKWQGFYMTLHVIGFIDL